MKVAVLGGGGFRTPLMWLSVAEDAGVDEVALHDVSESRLLRICAVIEGLRRERGGGPPVRSTTRVKEAVDGADVIFCALRVGGLEGRVVDETVPLRHGVLGQETVGPGGIWFALRTLPVMLEVARAVRAAAPSAWFLNFTNPAGLVTEALRDYLGDRVVGICDSPEALCARVAAALGRRRRDLTFDYAGINHLGWLLRVRDSERDLLPDLLADERAAGSLEEGRLFGAAALRESGMIPNEYLVYYESPGAIVDAFRRAGATRGEQLLTQQSRFYDAGEEDPGEALASWRRARDARFGSYMAEAWEAVGETPDGALPHDEGGALPHDEGGADGADATTGAPGDAPQPDGDEGPGAAGYAAIAASFLRSAARRADETLIVNVANRGRLPFLDDGAVVEVPCTITAAGPRSRAVGRLPSAQAELVARVKEVERTTIRAAVEGSRRLALQALIAHPLVPTRAVAEKILTGYLASSPEVAERLR